MTDLLPAQTASRIEDLERTCFVIMPFGKKPVGDREVDFTQLYNELFAPAIAAAKTPEGDALVPARTDMDAFSGSINQDMYEYIVYSRVAFADISGFNPNVFYEIGARHAVQEAGTVLFRRAGHAIPFDIATIKIFEYADSSDAELEASRAFIAEVLSESLKRNRLDSPIRLALRAQWGGAGESAPRPAASGAQTGAASGPEHASEPRDQSATWRMQEVNRFLRDAEEALRIDDLDAARMHYWGALRFDPTNLMARMRLGLVRKRQGELYRALEEFTMVTKLVPDYAEAWKEKGVIEGLIARTIPAPARQKASWLPDGSESLRRAALLNPQDFDAWASLGGVLSKVRQDFEGAHQAYTKAAQVSGGHPYPLLNALKLEARRTGRLDLEAARDQLTRAESMRRGQAAATPPTDTPWCFFDLAEISLYKKDKSAFLDFVEQGIAACTASWQPKTFRDGLQNTLVDNQIQLSGLTEGIALLDAAIASYSNGG